MTPQLKKQTIIDCLGLDEMEDCYEMLSPTAESNYNEMIILSKTIEDFRKKRIPYCVTVNTDKTPSTLHFWVEGVEKKFDATENNKSTRINGVAS